jgi:hypothetical protein
MGGGRQMIFAQVVTTILAAIFGGIFIAIVWPERPKRKRIYRFEIGQSVLYKDKQYFIFERVWVGLNFYYRLSKDGKLIHGKNLKPIK